jgi:hypothetical protein
MVNHGFNQLFIMIAFAKALDTLFGLSLMRGVTASQAILCRRKTVKQSLNTAASAQDRKCN